MKKSLILALTAMSLLVAGTAMATTWVESGDAGATIGTAQAVAAGTTKITGTYSNTDADLFLSAGEVEGFMPTQLELLLIRNYFCSTPAVKASKVMMMGLVLVGRLICSLHH